MFFFQGLTMGLAYVAPIGMQNLFVIHSALSHSERWRSSLLDKHTMPGHGLRRTIQPA